MSDQQVYLVGNWETGCAMLQCERDECRVPGNCVSGLCWWTEDLPPNATWQDARDAYIRHMATHYPEKLLTAAQDSPNLYRYAEQLLTGQEP